MFQETNDNSELISVLMAVYNTKVDYLREAVNSVLNQTYRNIEFVIIDDGSDKIETQSYLSDLKDERIRIYRNSENCGLTKSLIKGMALCNGRYVARLDADDVALPNRIENQYRYIKKGNYAIVGCNWFLIASKKKHPICMYETEAYRIDMAFDNQGPIHSTFFIDKEKINALGINYNENYATSQDYGLLCDCISGNARIGFCPITLSGWRDHCDQISKTKKVYQKADASVIRRDYITKNFLISSTDLEVFIKCIDNGAYEKVSNIEETERALKNFIICNPGRIMDFETHKFWFQQSLKRFIRMSRIDFVQTRMFRECLRPDRFLYTVFALLQERKHNIMDMFEYKIWIRKENF